ncbi:MAG: hypothetical protein J6334_03310 [Kiritimatiellae bacterium]|nr:hypothetical protein [Kiritimatiellia bacterium]
MTFKPAINPVALKELRQLVRSKLILWSMVVIPIILLGVMTLVLSAKMRDLSPNEIALGKGFGDHTLTAVSIITGIVTCCAIPLFAAIKTILETNKERFDLAFTTTLTPVQIVTGKITAVAIIAAITVALAMPFFVLSYLMRGIDLSTTLLVPLALLAGSIAIFSLGLLPACAPRPAAVRIIVLLVMLAFLPGFLSLLSAAFIAVGGHFWMDSGATFLDVAVLCLLFVSLVAYCRAQAAAELTPPHLDSFRPLRITQTILFVVSALLLLDPDARETWYLVWRFVALMILLRAAWYPAPLSRGARHHAPRRMFLRLLAFPFATGSVPSMLFALLILASITPVTSFLPKAGAVMKHLVITGEFAGLAVIAGSLARLFITRYRRFAYAIGKIAFVYVVFVNALSLLAEMDIIDKETPRPLPCNFDGIAHRIGPHPDTALLLAIVALILFALSLNEFREFRKP